MIDLIAAIPFPDWISPTIFSIGPVSVKWYGVAYVVGVMLAYVWALHLTKQKAIWLPNGITRGNALVPDKVILEDFVFFALLGIILGGRLGSILLYNTGEYIADPIKIFKIWEGGMAFHGGFLGVCAALIYTSRTRKIGLWRIADGCKSPPP